MDSMKGCSDRHRTCGIVLLAVALFLSLNLLLPTTSASIRISFLMQSSVAVTAPPVILQTGTAGSSLIYVSSTSAKVNVGALNWLGGWDRRVKITINSSDIDETLVDFPVLVYLSNSSSGENDEDVSCVFSEIGSSFKRMAFTLSDGGTQCYVEVEKWDGPNQKAWLWIKVPSISSTKDTVLYLYYDGDHADNDDYVGDTGSSAAQNVWDSSFKGVWHLSQTSGGIGAIEDSTSNNNAGTDYGNPAFNANGLINSAISFDGTDDFINMSNSASLQFIDSLTIEAWAKLDSFGSGSDVDALLRKGEANPNDFQLAVHDQRLELIIEENDDGGLHGSTTLSATTWLHLVGTWNGTTRKVYLNGTEDGSGSKTGVITPDTRAMYIGGRAGTDLSAGIIDEVRASNKVRSAAWIKASYESEIDDLVDFGPEETNMEDHVDDSASDVGPPTDIGTHSNFTAQQYGPDSIYDTLNEQDTATGNITYLNSAESYSATGQSSHNFNYALQKGSGDERLVVVTVSWEDLEASATVSSLAFGGIAMTKIADVTVGTGYSEYISLWYLLDSSLPNSPGSYNIAVTVSQSITREIYIAVAEYSGVRQSAPDDYDTNANTVSGNTAITLTAAANGSIVVAGVGESGANVLTNTNNIANLQLQLLTSSGSALGHHPDVIEGNITVGWNNLNTREGMAGAVWQPSHTNYELDLEVQWTNANYTLANEELCIKTGTTGAEDFEVDVWSGSGWVNFFADLTPDSWNNISVSTYLTSSNFTIRFKGGSEINDHIHDLWNLDAAILHVWSSIEATYDYVLGVNNPITSQWQVRLKEYSSSGIARLQNCTISFHNSTDGTSNQIVIENGSFTTQTGSWYSLGSLETIYIAMTVRASSMGTSYIYAYLEVLIPGTTTYAQYITTFEVN